MSALVNFAKRHKKKLIFTVVFFGGGYWGIKYSFNKLTESFLLASNSANLANDEFISMRKHEHYLTIKQTSDEAILELIKSMIDQINQYFASEDLLEELKSKPSNRLEIWEKLKIISVSKALTNIYALALLALFLKVELNIIGAYLFLSNSFTDISLINLNNSIENTEELLEQQDHALSANVQQKYLENIEIFVKKGLPNLMKKIYKLTEEEFKDVNLKENLTVEILSKKFENIREKLEKPTNNTDSFINSYLLTHFNMNDVTFSNFDLSPIKHNEVPKVNRIFKSDDEILFNLNLETYDILNCKDFYQCFKSLVNYFSNELLNSLTSSIITQLMQNEMNGTEKIEASLPYAKLIPVFDKYYLTYNQPNSVVLKNMLNDINLCIFSANIYEAFSVKYTTTSNLYNELKSDLIINQLE